jgi:hypothetical protein
MRVYLFFQDELRMVNDGVLTWKAHHTLYLALLVRNYGQHSLPSLLP